MFLWTFARACGRNECTPVLWFPATFLAPPPIRTLTFGLARRNLDWSFGIEVKSQCFRQVLASPVRWPIRQTKSTVAPYSIFMMVNGQVP